MAGRGRRGEQRREDSGRGGERGREDSGRGGGVEREGRRQTLVTIRSHWWISEESRHGTSR